MNNDQELHTLPPIHKNFLPRDQRNEDRPAEIENELAGGNTSGIVPMVIRSQDDTQMRGPQIITEDEFVRKDSYENSALDLLPEEEKNPQNIKAIEESLGYKFMNIQRKKGNAKVHALGGLFPASAPRHKEPQFIKNIGDQKETFMKKLKKNFGIDQKYSAELKDSSVSHILMQAKVIGDLKRINRINDDGDDDSQSSSSESDQGEFQTQEFDPGAKNQFENKQIFRKNYGIEMELPNLHIIDAKVYPSDQNFFIRVVKYSIPNEKDEEYFVKTFENGKAPYKESIKQAFSDKQYKKDHVAIELFEKQDDKFVLLKSSITFHCKNRVQILFSPDGKYLAILYLNPKQTSYNVNIYKIDGNDKESLRNMMQEIEDGEKVFMSVHNLNLQTIPKILFDRGSRYFGIYDINDLSIWKVNKSFNATPEIYNLAEDMFISILTVGMTSTETEFNCKIAAMKRDRKAVYVLNFDKKKENENEKMIIDVELVKPQAVFSENMNKMIVTTDQFVFLLSHHHHDGGKCQQTQIQRQSNKIIAQILPTETDFLLLYHKEYDSSYKLGATHDENFKIKIPQQVVPYGNTRFFDIIQTDQNEEEVGARKDLCGKGLGKQLIILSGEDSNLKLFQMYPRDALDTTDPEIEREYKSKNSNVGKQNKVIEMKVKFQAAKCSTWPYFAQADQDNNIWLLCAFDHLIIKKLKIPILGKNAEIDELFITSDFDLFVLVKHQKGELANNFEIFCIDLDYPKDFVDFDDQIVEIFKSGMLTFPWEKVHNEECYDMFARSSTSKKESGTNKQMMVFILFQNHLYYWKEGMNTIKLVSMASPGQLRIMNEESFAYFNDIHDIDGNHTQEVKMITCLFSSFKSDMLHQEVYKKEGLLEWEANIYDAQDQKYVNIFRSKEDKTRKKCVVYDLKEKKEVIQAWITDPELIGQFKAQMYKFVDSHMYFANRVFKFRYDNANKCVTKNILQEELVDKYNGILNLGRGEKVLMKMPMLSINESKQIYCYTNIRTRGPMKVNILPFLHDRKIFLNKVKNDRVFFSTVIEDIEKISKQPVNKMIQIDFTDSKYSVYNEKGLLKDRIHFKETVKECGKVVSVSKNGIFYLFHKSGKCPTFYVMKLTSNKGFIKKRKINLEDEITTYFREQLNNKNLPVDELSRVESMKKRLEGPFEHFLIESGMDYQFCINDEMDFLVEFKSKLDDILDKNLKQLFPKKEHEAIITGLSRLSRALNDDQLLDHIIRKNKFNFVMEYIPEEMRPKISEQTVDFFLRKQDPEFYMQLQNATSSKGSIVFISQHSDDTSFASTCPQCVEEDNGEKQCHKNIMFFTQDDRSKIFNNLYKHGNFTMNKRYAFFFNNSNVYKLSLHNSERSLPDFQKLDICVDPSNIHSRIRAVHASNNQDKITIRIKQSKDLDMILLWNVSTNKEESSFDCSPSAFSFYDKGGNVFILDQGFIVNTSMGCKLSTYDLISPDQNKKALFKYQQGFRFDQKNHNWILFHEFLSLSFSFMTLVIRDYHQKKSRYNYDPSVDFDPECYNYHINRQTFLTCDNFSLLNSDGLEYILGALEKVDPKLLHLVNYYYEQKKSSRDQQNLSQSTIFNAMDGAASMMKSFIGIGEEGKEVSGIVTPLHKVMENSRSASIILKYMSRVGSCNSEVYKEILPELTENTNFIMFLDSLRYQTEEMKRKNNLAIAEAYNDQIVGIYPSSKGFVDQNFYTNTIKENFDNPSFKKFMVRMTSLRVEWFFQKSGKDFFQALLSSDNLEIFRSKSIISVTEFMYMHYKKAILWRQLPIYAIQLVIFFMSINFENHKEKADFDSSGEFGILKTTGNEDVTEEGLFNIVTLLDILNLCSVAYSLFFLGIKARNQGTILLWRAWTYFDIIYIIILTVISIESLTYTFDSEVNDEETTKSMTQSIRRLQSILCITIFGKLLYYLQLLDEVAPLIKIINAIFYDIRWFMLVFLVTIFAFSQSFYLLGKSQLEFDNIPEDDQNSPEYGISNTKAFLHVYLLSMGEFGIDAYTNGDGSEEMLLTIYFYICSFLLMLHFLNMLIAIMGDTFGKTNETKDIFQVKQHLSFIIDNWYTDAIPNKESICYLISAFYVDDEQSEQAILAELREQIRLMDIKNDEKHKLMLEKIEEMDDNVMSR